MDWVSTLFLMLGMICAFMALGLPVAFAFLLANIVGAGRKMRIINDMLRP